MEQLSDDATKDSRQDVSQKHVTEVGATMSITQDVTEVSTQGITEVMALDRSVVGEDDDVTQDHITQDSSVEDDGILDDDISGGNHDDGDDALLGDDSELDYNEDIDDDHHGNSDEHHHDSDDHDDNSEEHSQELLTPVSITCLTG